MSLTAAAVSKPVREAVARHGFAPRRIVLISPLGERKGRRSAYRVENEDGRIVKAREFESDEAARRNIELRVGLEEAFAPPLVRYGAVLIEEWIDGVPLTELDWESWVGAAGTLLGRLHTSRSMPRESKTVSTHTWLARAGAALELLVATGKLDREEAALVRAEIERRDPRVARTALVHMDFCADNMLIDARGRLRVIDNELIAIDPAGFDLARTFHLWPMPRRTRTHFDRAYRSAAPAEPGASDFWRLIATLLGASIFLHRSPVRLDASLALLRHLIEGDDAVE